MDDAMRILRFSSFCLFLLLSSGCGGCGGATFIDVKEPPEAVLKAAERRWPHARVKSASRVYGYGSWGDYSLDLELADGGDATVQITPDGVVKWSFPSQP